MSEFWVSKNGQVCATPLTRDQVQEQFIDKGADLSLPVMKVGGTEWKTAADYGFAPAEKPESVTQEFRAVSPVIFWGEKHFCVIYGKTELDRKKQSIDLADFLNKNNYKPL